MPGFLAVFLQKNLQFSQEHVAEIKNKTQQSLNREKSYEARFHFHNNQIAFGFRGSTKCNFENSQQPFLFGDGRYCLLFSGKIYNGTMLRNLLQKKGYHFETELMIEVIATLFLARLSAAFDKNPSKAAFSCTETLVYRHLALENVNVVT